MNKGKNQVRNNLLNLVMQDVHIDGYLFRRKVKKVRKHLGVKCPSFPLSRSQTRSKRATSHIQQNPPVARQAQHIERTLSQPFASTSSSNDLIVLIRRVFILFSSPPCQSAIYGRKRRSKRYLQHQKPLLRFEFCDIQN